MLTAAKAVLAAYRLLREFPEAIDEIFPKIRRLSLAAPRIRSPRSQPSFTVLVHSPCSQAFISQLLVHRLALEDGHPSIVSAAVNALSELIV